ncbi:MAG TPA: hypothetical protein DCP31_12605, partial [Cyanobacteria bacterium UBA8543]|nr:hypothetical protein [Cyanobacteria bacterium UBA8543]
DQVIDQAIAPRLLGSFTGLRPVWVLISLAVGTYVGGLLGLVIAVPLAGFIKSLIDGWPDTTESDSNNGVKLVAPESNSSYEGEESPELFTKESTSAET